MENKSDKKIFFRNINDQKVLHSIVDIIPRGTRVYLYGGAARNALYHKLFGKWLPQRDYDLVVIGDYKKFIKKLKTIGFISGKKSKVFGKMVLKKPLVKKPRTLNDCLWIDMVLREHGQILSLLKKRANFTINGIALPIVQAFQSDWQKHIVAVPHALADLRDKKLRTQVIHPIDIYAVIRFVSLGFRAPTKIEIKQILDKLKNIERWRFERDAKKVINYVGSKEKVLKIAKKLGIKINILNYENCSRQSE
ncbi:MAG: hypothetical protein PHE24_04725 [Patescibacteria group bacterium]|nr:hypothetical protein [Patescibacteria group bacterium]